VTDYTSILTEQRGRVATITLNRPQALNALNDVLAAEVADAVAYYVGTSPLRFATADGVADQAASQVLGGLPSDYLDTSLAALRTVTPESATAAYTSVVDAGAASLVVVGDADQLAEPLRALGYHDLLVTEG
jgi:predicted Zn-dependent peptidase